MYRGSTQHKGMCMVPKRAVDVMSCQIVRLLQLTQSAIVPIGYHVQRKVRKGDAVVPRLSPRSVFIQPILVPRPALSLLCFSSLVLLFLHL